MYLVIQNFVDLADKCHRYKVGETYPRKGYKPDEERIKALVSGDNKAGVKLIKEVKAPAKKKTSKKKATPKGGKKASK